jgi:hypothetical protein
LLIFNSLDYTLFAVFNDIKKQNSSLAHQNYLIQENTLAIHALSLPYGPARKIQKQEKQHTTWVGPRCIQLRLRRLDENEHKVFS